MSPLLQIICDVHLPPLVDLLHQLGHVRVQDRAGVREPDEPEVRPLWIGHNLQRSGYLEVKLIIIQDNSLAIKLGG